MSAPSPPARVPAELRYPGKDPSPATVTLRRRDRRERIARVVRTWALCWLAAVAAVFLPLLHFVLVPALFVGGPLYALSLRHEHATLLHVEGACPACGARVTQALRGRAVPAVVLRCDGCGRALGLAVDPACLGEGDA